VAFLAALSTQRGTGLADNGDFLRGIRLFTSGPVGFESGWEQPNAQEFQRRFFEFWLPDWKESPRIARPNSSALLLWAPGLLADAFITPGRVHLPTLAWVHKLLLLGFLCAAAWISFSFPGAATSARRYAFALLLGLPLLLMFATADYTVYLASFYQESASFVYGVFFVGALALLKAKPTRARFWGALALLALLATAKRSNLYWPLLGVPALFYAYPASGAGARRLLVAAAWIVGLTGASWMITAPNAHPANPYHSLYYGLLPLSDRPAEHLERLGLAGSGECVGRVAYKPPGTQCLQKAGDKASFGSVLDVLAHEPVLAFRVAGFTLDRMQDLSLDYLGHFAQGDPRHAPIPMTEAQVIEAHYMRASGTSTGFNAWSEFKFRFFPRGVALAAVLAGLLVFFASSLRRAGWSGALALAGCVATVACGLDMAVAAMGDGRYELIKHLFMANTMFDLALILGVNAAALRGLAVPQRPREGPLINSGT
jgi:hypothetical protein